MAEISQKDQLALHEFSMRMREAVAARSEKDQDLSPVIEAVREQYSMEQEAKNAPAIEPASPATEPEKNEPEP